jgi:LuxR family transcriptional regulator, maltose regulon positive regulatory protein
MSQTARFRETLRKLAMIDEGFVKDEAGLALGPAGTSALDPKTAALLQVGASVMSTMEIADELCLSVNTVKTHLAAIYRKLPASRRRDAVLRARELELI